jgi:hypothetical protein
LECDENDRNEAAPSQRRRLMRPEEVPPSVMQASQLEQRKNELESIVNKSQDVRTPHTDGVKDEDTSSRESEKPQSPVDGSEDWSINIYRISQKHGGGISESPLSHEVSEGNEEPDEEWIEVLADHHSHRDKDRDRRRTYYFGRRRSRIGRQYGQRR